MARAIEVDVLIKEGGTVLAEFRHSESANGRDLKEGRIDVTSVVTLTDSFSNTGGIYDDVVAECKDYIQNTGNYAGGSYEGGEYDSDTWA